MIDETSYASDVADELGLTLSAYAEDVTGAVDLTSAAYGEDVAEAVNDWDEEPDLTGVTKKFLHISDSHGAYAAAQVCKERIAAGTDEFLLLTGDVSEYNVSGSNGLTADLKTQLDAIPSGKLLMCAGNHDTYENRFGTSGVSQAATTAFLKSYLGNNVTWGDTNNVASYWHKDIQLASSSKLRIISLDQYEIDVVRKPSNFYTMYSQTQINWFIARLKEMRATDFLIVVLHEPPVQSPAGNSDDEYAVGLRATSPYYDGNDELNEPLKLFVSEGLNQFGNRRDEPNLNLLPRIMDAYLNKRSLSLAYNNKGGGTPKDITISETFTGNPCTFLFWIGGHQHCDIGTYLPDESNETDGGDWSNQLMLFVTADYYYTMYQSNDDLGGRYTNLPIPSNPVTYRINEVELDFELQTIKVTRIGAQNTAGGRVRNTITFPFKKQ